MGRAGEPLGGSGRRGKDEVRGSDGRLWLLTRHFINREQRRATLMWQSERRQEKRPIPLESVNAIIHTQSDEPFSRSGRVKREVIGGHTASLTPET